MILQAGFVMAKLQRRFDAGMGFCIFKAAQGPIRLRKRMLHPKRRFNKATSVDVANPINELVIACRKFIVNSFGANNLS